MNEREEILSIASDLREGSITTKEAKELLLTLFGVSDGFKNEKEHFCWAHADFNDKCMVCGKENCSQ